MASPKGVYNTVHLVACCGVNTGLWDLRAVMVELQQIAHRQLQLGCPSFQVLQPCTCSTTGSTHTGGAAFTFELVFRRVLQRRV